MANIARQSRMSGLFAFISVYLILECLWRLFTRGGPWPVRPWPYISMGFDLLMLVALIVLWRSLSPRGLAATSPVAWQTWLFRLATTAGVVLLLLRFTSEHAFWTGHLPAGF